MYEDLERDVVDIGHQREIATFSKRYYNRGCSFSSIRLTEDV